MPVVCCYRVVVINKYTMPIVCCYRVVVINKYTMDYGGWSELEPISGGNSRIIMNWKMWRAVLLSSSLRWEKNWKLSTTTMTFVEIWTREIFMAPSVYKRHPALWRGGGNGEKWWKMVKNGEQFLWWIGSQNLQISPFFTIFHHFFKVF